MSTNLCHFCVFSLSFSLILDPFRVYLTGKSCCRANPKIIPKTNRNPIQFPFSNYFRIFSDLFIFRQMIFPINFSQKKKKDSNFAKNFIVFLFFWIIFIWDFQSIFFCCLWALRLLQHVAKLLLEPIRYKPLFSLDTNRYSLATFWGPAMCGLETFPFCSSQHFRFSVLNYFPIIVLFFIDYSQFLFFPKIFIEFNFIFN